MKQPLTIVVTRHEGDGALVRIHVDVDPGAWCDGHVMVRGQVRNGQPLDIAQLNEVDEASRTKTF